MFASIVNILGKAASSPYLDNPIFVVGASRSGTSILLQALGKHPKVISSPGEAPFLTSIGGAVSEFELADNRQYFNESLICKKTYLYDQLKRLAIETTCGAHYGLRNYTKACVLEKRLVRPRHWSAKTFPPRVVADALQILFPNARFLYIVRNGIEVVQSMTKFSGFTDRSFAANCRAWSSSADTFDYLNTFPTALAVRHEDLKADPAAFFERVFSFLQLASDPIVTEFVTHTVVHPLDSETKQKTDAMQEFTERPPPYLDWTADQKMAFVDICSAAMARLGYEVPFANEAIKRPADPDDALPA